MTFHTLWQLWVVGCEIGLIIDHQHLWSKEIYPLLDTGTGPHNAHTTPYTYAHRKPVFSLYRRGRGCSFNSSGMSKHSWPMLFLVLFRENLARTNGTPVTNQTLLPVPGIEPGLQRSQARSITNLTTPKLNYELCGVWGWFIFWYCCRRVTPAHRQLKVRLSLKKTLQ